MKKDEYKEKLHDAYKRISELEAVVKEYDEIKDFLEEQRKDWEELIEELNEKKKEYSALNSEVKKFMKEIKKNNI